ncbi:type 2 lanthipeptide synthetase LanM family protein [Thalassomonas actiniarum]|uniref:Type 2 lantipeptide synthetase LanM n=1 Tax=Thalassomonas actiniarum TaxID=485447 RepID=A0AAE9YW55_9GAMM|nr:type 2 lanthipeptide synthetase LanM family protein [Thalassomonas actiniarum]WDE02286.1 type 2 lantipeptide synthetase LanM [Thalassomonas actiniarum]
MDSQNTSEQQDVQTLLSISDIDFSWALALAERKHGLSDNISSSNINTELADYWLSRQPFQENTSLFLQRLKTDNLDLESFKFITAESSHDLGKRIPQQPQWLNDLKAAFNKDHSSVKLPSVNPPGMVSGDLLTLIKPLMQQGVEELRSALNRLMPQEDKQGIDLVSCCDQLFEELLSRLAMICGRTLVMELQIARVEQKLQGDSSQERFNDFVARLTDNNVRSALLQDYPVMARLVVETIQRWQESALELFKRLFADWPALQQTFNQGKELGQVCKVKTAEGDSHRGGRTVAILEFSCGMKLVYKPRSVAVEAAFGQLLAWLNDKGFSTPFKSLLSYEAKTHGWVEFAQQQSCQDKSALKRFYRRQGGLLALLYALEANDFHYENLIACGEHPVLVDLETLFHPWLGQENSGGGDANEPPAAALKRTVLATGLLPRRIWTQRGEGEGVDLSGFSEVQDQQTPMPVLDIEHAGTDQMQFTRKVVSFPGANNMPTLKGATIKAQDFSDDIVAGFAELFSLLLSCRDKLLAPSGPLSAFNTAEVRVIFRETRVYASFLMESLHPDFMGNALERDIFFDQLWVASGHRKYLTPLIKSEHESLRRMDIPLFTTRPDSKDVVTDSGEIFKDFFPTSGMSRVRQKIKSLTHTELTRQCWVIQSSLLSADLSNRPACHSHIDLAEHEQPATIEELLDGARDLAGRISELAFRSGGGASWFTWKAVGNSHWDLEPMTPTLYDGLAGVTLFLAYLGQVDDNNAYQELAREALHSAQYLWRNHPDDIQDIGMFSGWSGIIYLLCHLGCIWQDESLFDEAESLVVHISKQLAQDKNQDIVAGAAGAIIALLGLYRFRAKPSILALAEACGRHLQQRAQDTGTGTAWVLEAAGTEPLAGMSHGVAGIAWAMFALSQVSKDNSFADTAKQALLYERNLYCERMSNWPDLRQGKRPETSVQDEGYYYMTGWCHGAPGIGLARLAMFSYREDEQLRDEIQAALKTTLASGFEDNHSLCHGSLGNLDLLLQGGKILNRHELTEQAKKMAKQLLSGKQSSGWVSGYMHNLETPGFMVGLAGMGYQLLRVAYPDRVPSILALELPATDIALTESGSPKGKVCMQPY